MVIFINDVTFDTNLINNQNYKSLKALKNKYNYNKLIQIGYIYSAYNKI